MADDVGVLVARVVADTEQFRSEMLRVSNQLASNTAKMNSALAKVQESGASVTKVLDGMKGALITLGVAFSVGAIIKFAKDTLDAAASLQHLSERLNVSVESLSQLQYVAKITDVSFDSLTRSMSFMVKTIGEAQRGTKAAVDVFAELGLNFQILSKLTVDEQFAAVAEALSKVDNEAERSALAVKVFSRSGQEMLQIVNQGPDALRKMQQEARDLGGVMSGDTAKAAAEAKDALDRLAFSANGLANNALPTLAHALEVVATGWNALLFNASPFPFQAQIDTLTSRIHIMSEQLRSSGGMSAEWKSNFQKDIDALIEKLAELKTAQEKALGIGIGGIGGAQGAPAGLNIDRTKDSGGGKKRSADYANLLFGMSTDQLIEIYNNIGLKEIEVTARKNEVMLSMEDQIQSDINAAREKTLAMDIKRGLAGIDAAREYAEARKDIELDVLSTTGFALDQIMQLSQGHNKTLFNLAKKAAIANAIIYAYEGIALTLKTYPFPWNIAMAAAQAVVAFAQVRRIQSTSFESSSASGGVGASGGGAAVPAQSQSSTASNTASTAVRNKQREVTIQFMGPIYGWDDYIRSKVIDSIRDAVDGRDVVIIGPNSRQAQLLTQP